MEILLDSNTEHSNPHGYVTVRTRSKPSYKLREQGHFPADGVFDIEADALTIVPSRSDEVPANSRWKRRIKKRYEYAASRIQAIIDERKGVGEPTQNS